VLCTPKQYQKGTNLCAAASLQLELGATASLSLI